MLPVKRTIKNNKFLYRQPCYGWRQTVDKVQQLLGFSTFRTVFLI